MLTVDFKRLSIRSGDRILDVGCGSGRHMAAAHQYRGTTTLGTDLSYETLEAARSRMRLLDQYDPGCGGRWALFTADGNRLPFKNSAFDVVICSEVLEHISGQHRFVGQLYRVLKPKGLLAVSVPRYLPEWICWRLQPDYAGRSGGHIRIYRKRELLELCQRSGFKVLATHYAHSLHAPYWWLKCAIGTHRRFQALIDGYHRFLVWDIMHKPALTRLMDRWLNPLIGKSLVAYFRKNGDTLHDAHRCS